MLKVYISNLTGILCTFPIRCTWKGKQCSTENFKRVMTDLGKCYTFHNEDLNVERAGWYNFTNFLGSRSDFISCVYSILPFFVGPGFGLTLTLNIEQYDYTRDPSFGVGIMVGIISILIYCIFV